MIDIEKNYRVARKLVGNLNKDLVHHCFLKIHEKQDIRHPDSYFYRVMLSELRKDSKFFKAYILENRELKDVKQEYNNRSSTHQLNDILDVLREQGYTEEVEIFLLSKQMPIKEICKKTNIKRTTIYKICKFVKHKVLELWEY